MTTYEISKQIRRIEDTIVKFCERTETVIALPIPTDEVTWGNRVGAFAALIDVSVIMLKDIQSLLEGDATYAQKVWVHSLGAKVRRALEHIQLRLAALEKHAIDLAD